MLVIGLTGGMGTGKSEVARILKELGAELIDVDRLGHEAYRPQSEGWKAVVAEFGEGILQPDGEVDRKKLGAIVFSDPQALLRLNALLHPRMYGMIEERLQALDRTGAPVAVVDAAVLIEGGWTPLVDEIWVTVADEENVVKRVAQRSNLSAKEIRQRIRAQIGQEERLRYATVVIENNKDLDTLRKRVKELWDSRMRGRAS
ncbi:MAG: dephospho-CoA kinase [Chloroflexi bacterium]|nr:dephospho-CoA kinase [Chloroflexota bacterium]